MSIKSNSKPPKIYETSYLNEEASPFISIIIPTYNVEKYISRAIKSCINQTLNNIEILIIDDCGNDKSIDIAKDYANKDSRN